MNITDTLRIKRHDERNIIIERYETTTNPRTKEEVQSWKREGFYPTVKVALQAVLSKDMLIDLNDIKTLTAYNEAFKKQVKVVEDIRMLAGTIIEKDYKIELLEKQIKRLKENAE